MLSEYFKLLKAGLGDALAHSRGEKKLKTTKVQVMQGDQLTLLKQARKDMKKALKDWNPDPSKLKPEEMKIFAHCQHQLAKIEEMIERQERFKKWKI